MPIVKKIWFYDFWENLKMYSVCLLLAASLVVAEDLSAGGPQGAAMKQDTSTFKSPTFLSTPQEFSVPVGSDVSFPCEYDTQGSKETLYMMIFKYVSPKDEDRIYFAGDTKVAHIPRIKKEGSSFILSNVKITDLGSYACRFETKPLTQIVHKLQVLYPPKVWRESAELQRVSQGSSVLLQCSADGNPKPTIEWSRQGGMLPSGTKNEMGFSITLEEVDRHVEGTYTCTASNGIGTPVTASMTVQVEYPPEIISEQSIIHTGEGNDAKLVCVVHGRPSPDVTWLRGRRLISSDKHLMTQDGSHRHTLTIVKVTEEDFGEYTCRAQNTIGQAEKQVRLTGLPQKPQITSSPGGGQKTSFALLWATETSSPIVQYRLRYRQIKGLHKVDSEWKDSVYFPNNDNIIQVRQGVYQIKHLLRELQPSDEFEAIVQVENKFGWSQTSDLFRFRTMSEEPVTTTAAAAYPRAFDHGPKVEEMAVGQSASGGRSMVLTRNLLLTLATLCLLRFHLTV